MPRTGSMASKVGPGRDRQRVLPASGLGWTGAAARSSTISPVRACAASPISPQAWSPVPGPRIATPSARSCAIALRGRGRPHLAVHRRRHEQVGIRARCRACVSRSSHRPLASLARRSVEAGRSGWHRPRARGRCAAMLLVDARVPLRQEHGPPWTAPAWSLRVMKCVAASVSRHLQRWPRPWSAAGPARPTCSRRCRRSGQGRCACLADPWVGPQGLQPRTTNAVAVRPRISSTAPTVIAQSATLNAGKCMLRKWKSRKSITWPCSTRSIHDIADRAAEDQRHRQAEQLLPRYGGTAARR